MAGVSLKGLSFAVLALVAVGSVGARWWLGEEGAAGTTPGGAAALLPSVESSVAAEDGPLRDALPYLSEGSFFGLIGFALGYLSRKVIKLGLIVLALFFLAVQGLSWAGVLTVDWDRALEVVNDLVLDVNENETLGEIVKNRIPAAGGLVVGYALGFRRG